MPRPRKIVCRWCNKKFHPSGIFGHDRGCKKKPKPPMLQAEAVNFVNKHPREVMRESIEKLWNCLSTSEKMLALALFEARQESY